MNDELLMLPGPTNVDESIKKVLSNPMISHRGETWHKLYEECQEGLKYLFQTKNTVYILTTSGTGGVECVASNLVKKGDKVLVPTNGEFGIRLADIFEVYGADVVRMPAEWGEWADPDKVEEILEKDKEIKMLAYVYNETSTGVRNPAKQLAEIGKKHGLLVICDGISNIGGDEMYMDKWDIDVVITGSQKAIACPPGLAFVSFNDKAWRKYEESKPHTNYYWNLEKLEKFHKKSETPFTPAVSLIFGLREALNIIKKEGIEKRVQRHVLASKALRAGVKALGLTVFPKDEKYASITVNAFNLLPNLNDTEIKQQMLKKHKIAITGGIGPTRGKILRIGTMGTVNEEQVLRTIKALEDVLKTQGVKVEEGKAEVEAKNVFEKK
ncbi:MAG: pyridoxal-phosphate-dependent aminotransferase family protein [Candidatus Odinarchaeia archaeon]